jgi:hypothetical protein
MTPANQLLAGAMGQPRQPRNPNMLDPNGMPISTAGAAPGAQPGMPDPMGGMQPMQGGQAAGAEPQPFADPNAFARAQFSGAGSDPNIQSNLALSRDQDARRQAAMGSDAAFDADLRRRADETYAEFERTLNPQWEERGRAFEQQLIGRGIDPNSEAGRNARAQFERDRTDAFSSARRQANADGQALQQQRWQQQFAQNQLDTQALAANAAMGANQSNLTYDREWRDRQFNEDRRRYDQGFGEDTRRYDQGFDFNMGQADFGQLMQLMGFDRDTTGFNNGMQGQEMSQMLPWLQMFMPQGGPQGIDVMGPMGAQFQGQQNQFQNQQQQRNAQNQMLGQVMQMLPMFLSDRRMKRDIRRIGTADNGLPLYTFRYIGKHDDGRVHVGPMAQEVEQVNPAAVTEVGGVKMVNYGEAFREPVRAAVA